MNNDIKRMQKLAGILSEGFFGFGGSKKDGDKKDSGKESDALGGKDVNPDQLAVDKKYRFYGYPQKERSSAASKSPEKAKSEAYYLANVIFVAKDPDYDEYKFKIDTVYDRRQGVEPDRGTNIVLKNNEVKALIKTAG